LKYVYDGVCLKNGRTQNMDSLLLTTRTINGSHALLAVVCDGVGRFADSAIASSTAVHLLNEWFADIVDVERVGLRMWDAVMEINRTIINQTNGIKVATTLSALLLVNGKYYIVNAGDSRVYCFENDELTLLTHDDISEDGKLTACIGRQDQPILAYHDGTSIGKTFLLCSDGLYRKMDIDYLISELRVKTKKDIRDSIVRLTDYVMGRGEQDNITVALVI